MRLSEHPDIKTLPAADLLELIGLLDHRPPGIPSTFIGPLGIRHIDRVGAKAKTFLFNHPEYGFGKFFDAIGVSLKFGIKPADFFKLVREAKSPKAFYDGFVALAGDNYNSDTIAGWNDTVAGFPFKGNLFWGVEFTQPGLDELAHGGFGEQGYDSKYPHGGELTTAGAVNPIDEFAELFDQADKLEAWLIAKGLGHIVEERYAEAVQAAEAAVAWATEQAAK